MGQKRANLSDPLLDVNFHCRAKGCGAKFRARPDRSAPAPEREHHPFAYFARCPECTAEAGQAAWEISLLAAWPNATGPKTPEGKAASAANLKGHPTPEEALLTRFNGMKHGLFARVANFFPAKPGRYPQCEGCEHLETRACVPQRACLKRTELYLRHQVAFDTRDPRLLVQLRSDTQAGIQGLIDDMLLTIAQDGGPRLKTPEWYYDKDGEFHLAKFIDADTGQEVQLHKLEAHPLLAMLMLYISKNAMTLHDLEMTPRSQDEADALEGFMDQHEPEKQASIEHQQRQTAALENLSAMIERSRERRGHDPVLIEHGEAEHG
jgi:hypothetical protein